MTDGRTDIWTRFWATSAQILLQFAEISGSGPKLQLYLCRPCSGTGPDGSLRCVTRSTRFKKSRIISTPLVRSGVPCWCSQAPKNMRGAINKFCSKKVSEISQKAFLVENQPSLLEFIEGSEDSPKNKFRPRKYDPSFALSWPMER